MKLIKLLLLIYICAPLISWSQEDYAKDVASYLEINGTEKQYVHAYDELLAMLKTQFPKTDKNSQGWTYLESNKEKAITEIKSLLVAAYQDNFEQDEIQKMIAFYTAGAGKQLVDDRTKLTEVQRSEIGDFYNSTVGQKIIEKQPVLAEAISKISEGWSSDLYQTAMTLLKE